MDLWELTARERIRDLLARYTWAGDRGRIAELTELFAPDGVLDLGDHGGRSEGRAAIGDELRAVVDRIATSGTGVGDRAAPGPVHHHVSSVLIDDLTATTATVRSYYAVHAATGLDHWGRYRDRVVRHDEEWRFAERIVLVDGWSAGSRVVRR